MKRKILALSGLVLFVAMLAWGSIAYFTAEDQAVNVLTIGSVDIQIEEYDQEGNRITDPYVMPASFRNIEPGQRLIKQVMIKNRGGNKAWVRAKIIDTITSAADAPLSESVLAYNVNQLNDASAQTASGTWTLGSDGYYYFSAPIAPGKTAVLFDVITFDGPSMGNAYQDCVTKIQVLAQAVQYEGNETCESDRWPAEPEHVTNEQNQPEEFYVTTGGEQP